MGLTVKQGGKDMPLIPEGVKIGVCYLVCDLGTQKGEWMGKEKLTHKVLIGWEIPGVRMKYEKDGEEHDAPRAIWQRYTLSLDKKANLRKHLDAWRGRSFTADELKGFDLKNVLGKACQIQVVHNDGKDGKTYANIGAIMALPEGMDAPAAENELQWFSLEEWDGVSNLPESIPEWMANDIKESQEWQQVARGNEALDAAHEQDDAVADLPPVGENTGDEDDGTELPF